MSHLNGLEPKIRELVEQFIAAGRPSAREQTFEQRRQGYLNTVSLAGEPEPVREISDVCIEGLPLRIYKPVEGRADLPVMVYFHGGCFVSGDFETHDRQMRALSNLAQGLVVAVHYRLAPEHPYPAAHDDALRSVEIVHEHARSWGGNPENITLAGDSAGGHLALVTCLRLKEQGAPLPARQILIYPMLDARGSSDSYRTLGDDYIITRDMLLSGFEAYLGEVSPDHPEASPLYRDDLGGLPETHILTAEFDPLLDEGEALYRKLLASGVRAHCRRYLGVNHGFIQLGGISPAARKALEDIAQVFGG